MKRKLLAILLSVSFIGLSGLQDVTAAESDEGLAIYESYAEQLKTMGLLQGTDDGFELDRMSTRLESVIMLIRLLGQEEEAAAQQPGMHPFRDVPAWGDKYVSYAYQNQLAAGIAADRFGSADGVTAEQYFAFVLRALGYSDAQGDFAWNRSVEAGVEAGIQTHADYGSATGPFLRANLVDISYHALQAKLKNQEMTLLEKLKHDGVADTGEDNEKSDNVSKVEGIAVPLREVSSSASDAWPRYSIDLSTITQYFAEAYSFSTTIGSAKAGSTELPGNDLQKMAILYALSNDNRIIFNHMDMDEPAAISLSGNPAILSSIAIWDRDGRMLAIIKPGSLSADDRTVKFLPGDHDIVQQVRTEWEQVATSVRDARYFPNDRFRLGYYEAPSTANDETPSTRQVKTMFVNRADLPQEARAFTKILTASYAGEWGKKLVSDQAGIRNQMKLLAGRTMIDKLRSFTSATTYHDEYGWTALLREDSPHPIELPLQQGSLSMETTFTLAVLQDDEGKFLAYTYFTEQDIQRIRSQ